ncbi:hypothetical protein [Phenylobacterium immobile]|uniref:hypothetical protein n=1 Tax=Phenylobacterium immobile TaxID=21 RepID=UPI000B8773EB|nr:hypothetical protein [Phenylobacterium immobile]
MYRYFIEIPGRAADELVEHADNATALRLLVGRLLDHADPARDLGPIQKAMDEGFVPSHSDPDYLFAEEKDAAGFWFRLAVLASTEAVSFHNDPDQSSSSFA